jgi:hypothetical protein
MTTPKTPERTPIPSLPERQPELSQDMQVDEIDRHFEQVAQTAPLDASKATLEGELARNEADYAAQAATANEQGEQPVQPSATTAGAPTPEQPAKLKKPTVEWLQELGQRDPREAVLALEEYVKKTKDVASVRDLFAKLAGEEGGADVVADVHADLTREKKKNQDSKG